MGNKSGSLEWAESGLQGRREYMEDAYAAITHFGGNQNWAFFGIYDGHFGGGCSKYIAANIPKLLLKEPKLNESPAEALVSAYLKCDKEYLAMAKEKKMLDGSTAVSVFIKGNKLFCANTGDSRAVMCQGGKAIALSEDQKPEHPKEQKRIESNGGVVLMGRVQGKLAVARAFGDPEFKNLDTLEPKYITAEPEVKTFDITQDTQFIIIACDGLWDKLSNQDAVNFVLRRINEGMPIKKICQELVQYSFQLGSQDNISAIIVRFPGANPASVLPPESVSTQQKQDAAQEQENKPKNKLNQDNDAETAKSDGATPKKRSQKATKKGSASKEGNKRSKKSSSAQDTE